jgi:hypothetical protein
MNIVFLNADSGKKKISGSINERKQGSQVIENMWVQLLLVKLQQMNNVRVSLLKH